MYYIDKIKTAAFPTVKSNKKHRHWTGPKREDLQRQAEQQAVVETMAHVMVGFLDHWTKKELAELSRANTVVCLQISKDHYKIGQFYLSRITDAAWNVSDQYNEHVHEFYSKQAAVFYCLFETSGKYPSANELLVLDRQLKKLKQEIDLYYEHLKKAVENKDEWKQDLYLARLSDVRPRMEYSRTNLQKTISHAKYSKVWENRK
jgi:hypothetical protein